jgi:hypothetical protein
MIGRSIVALAFVVAAGCGGGGAGSSDDVTRSGPLTVSDALRTRPAGVIAVRGAVLAHPDGSARLCEGLAGSYPPQCGGRSIEIRGLALDVLEYPDSAGGVTWGTATLRGRLDGDVLTLS